MDDLGFFEEVEQTISNKKPTTLARYTGRLLENTKLRKERTQTPAKSKSKSKSEIKFLSDSPVINPCDGCPYESKVKLLQGVGDIGKAKLLVITEKVTELDILNRSLSKNERYRKFLPIFLSQGFKEEDIYYTALTRCAGQENLDAISHCLNYLRKEILAPNIKCVLILGVRVTQILLDKDISTIFKNRGKIFEVLGKSTLIATEKLE
jgi:uracil-DNA glycosylase family 4